MCVGVLRAKCASLSLILLFFLFCQLILISQPAMAQVVPAQITDFEITTQDNRPVAAEELLASSTYKVHFTLDVAANVSGKVILTTDMERDGDRYWSLAPGEDYAGIDLDTWQPGQPSLSFEAVQGQVSLILEGHIPREHTTEVLVSETPESEETPDAEGTPVTQEILHFPREMMLLQLSVGEGEPLDTRTSVVIDDSIQEYRDTLAVKEGLLETVETEPEYAELVTDIIDEAKQQATAGRTDHAVALLDTIPDSDWVSPHVDVVAGIVARAQQEASADRIDQAQAILQDDPNTAWIVLDEDSGGSDILFIIIIAVLAVIAVIAIILMLRGKSETQFLKRRADDEARKLDLISARINRIGETSIADEINRVKDSLDAIRRGR